MHFNNSLKEYFSAINGAYSEVTHREYFDSQITLTGVEADIVENYFGKNNIQVGSVKSNIELSAKKFLLYPNFEEIELNLTYPKASKSELRLYLRKTFKPAGGDVFIVYLNEDKDLVIGKFPLNEWKEINKNYEDQINLFEEEEEEIYSDDEGTIESEIDNSSIMDKPFDPTEINIQTKTPSLDTLIKRIERENIQMDTSKYFQRRDDLWDEGKQSRLIESILIRFPLPAFYFDSTDDENWLVVDGLQRLSSIRNFCVDKTLKLEKLEFLTQLEGKNWDEISNDLKRLIEETQIVIYKIMPGTPTDVKFNIFKRINTGGISLAAQEIRHALFQGQPADFIYQLANCSEFIDATLGGIPTKRMTDRDFVNRFLAFYELGYKNYRPDLDTFMSKAMASLNDKSEYELRIIEDDFKGAMKLALEIFGRQAFRRPSKLSNRLTPVNKALFDSLATQFALLGSENREFLKANNNSFLVAFNNLLDNDNYFLTSITSSTGDKKRVNYRHSKIENIIKEILRLK